MVRGWLAASECQSEGGEKMLVDWFSGWPAGMREAAEAVGWKMVAVDNRGGLGAPHELNVMMDLLRVAPQFWRLEVARVLGVSVQRLGPNWFGIPCTTTSRGDAANSTRKKVKVWFNYRRTKHWLRDPQHGLGTPQGDMARETNRLVAGVCWVMEDAGESWAIENPDGQMKKMLELRKRERWLNRLDYCRLWSVEERKAGMLWQKMCCLWTMRKDGAAWGLGDSLKCRRLCGCRKGKSKEHLGQVETMTAMVKRSGRCREELKCAYPRQLPLKWLQWVTKAEHRTQLV
jgi:hypothetical protein